MAKRIADKELTDRNWDQEEEGEEVKPNYAQQRVTPAAAPLESGSLVVRSDYDICQCVV